MQPRNRAARFVIGALLLGCATPAAAQEGVDWSGAMAKREMAQANLIRALPIEASLGPIDNGFVPRRS